MLPDGCWRGKTLGLRPKPCLDPSPKKGLRTPRTFTEKGIPPTNGTQNFSGASVGGMPFSVKFFGFLNLSSKKGLGGVWGRAPRSYPSNNSQHPRRMDRRGCLQEGWLCRLCSGEQHPRDAVILQSFRFHADSSGGSNLSEGFSLYSLSRRTPNGKRHPERLSKNPLIKSSWSS